MGFEDLQQYGSLGGIAGFVLTIIILYDRYSGKKKGGKIVTYEDSVVIKIMKENTGVHQKMLDVLEKMERNQDKMSDKLIANQNAIITTLVEIKTAQISTCKNYKK